jgi:hypothetical protein
MNAVGQLSRPRNKIRVAIRPLVFAIVAVALTVGQSPPAAAGITIDFENEPSILLPQPNNFAAAGPVQTYSQLGVYSITGGVVLGNPTFLPAFSTRGTPPNLYGTTDTADPSLLPAITLTIFPSLFAIANEVVGTLFNGQPLKELYEVDAFSGAMRVDEKLVSTDESFSGGSAIFDVGSPSASLPITSVVMTPTDADLNGWDFLVDTIGINFLSFVLIPEPSSALILVTAVLGWLLLLFWRPNVKRYGIASFPREISKRTGTTV